MIKSSAYQRINITLPRKTLRLLDLAVPKGDRSHFIDKVVRQKIDQATKAELRKLMKERAIKYAAEDQAIAKECEPIAAETWQKMK